MIYFSFFLFFFFFFFFTSRSISTEPCTPSVKQNHDREREHVERSLALSPLFWRNKCEDPSLLYRRIIKWKLIKSRRSNLHFARFLFIVRVRFMRIFEERTFFTARLFLFSRRINVIHVYKCGNTVIIDCRIARNG